MKAIKVMVTIDEQGQLTLAHPSKFKNVFA